MSVASDGLTTRAPSLISDVRRCDANSLFGAELTTEIGYSPRVSARAFWPRSSKPQLVSMSASSIPANALPRRGNLVSNHIDKLSGNNNDFPDADALRETLDILMG